MRVQRVGECGAFWPARCGDPATGFERGRFPARFALRVLRPGRRDYAGEVRPHPRNAASRSRRFGRVARCSGTVRGNPMPPSHSIWPKDPRLGATLVRLHGTRHILVFTAHHIVCDGWSMNVIVNEILTCYGARRQGKKSDLPPAPSFRRYAMDQAEPKQDRGKSEAFWLGEYASLPSPLDLPTDRPRPSRRSFRGATYRDAIGADLMRTVKAAGARQGCTLFATLLSALQILVARLSGQDDVVIAVPTAGQKSGWPRWTRGPLRQPVADTLAAPSQPCRQRAIEIDEAWRSRSLRAPGLYLRHIGPPTRSAARPKPAASHPNPIQPGKVGRWAATGRFDGEDRAQRQGLQQLRSLHQLHRIG